MTSTYQPPDLPYAYSALKPAISPQLLELHHSKHHAAYVKGANETLDKLASARDADDFSQTGPLSKALAFHISGHVLHSLFWSCMTPDGGQPPSGRAVVYLIWPIAKAELTSVSAILPISFL